VHCNCLFLQTIRSAEIASRCGAGNTESIRRGARDPASTAKKADNREVRMHAVVRNYKGAPGLADELAKRQKDVESLIGTVPGFIAYYMVKTSDGATTVTVCQSRAGSEESSERASDWLRKNLPDMRVSPPQVVDGAVLFSFEQPEANRETGERQTGVPH
jgi:hypothetical protein